MNESPHRFRFSLLALLIAFFVVAVLAAFPSALWFISWTASLSGPCVFAVAFYVVLRASRSPTADKHWPDKRGWMLACIAILPLSVCWFIRHRWVSAFDDSAWPRPLPYPDQFLLQIHDWWDRLHPAGPDSIKIHGEYYAVLLGVNVSLLLACILSGAACGYILRNGDFLVASRRLTWLLRKGLRLTFALWQRAVGLVR